MAQARHDPADTGCRASSWPIQSIVTLAWMLGIFLVVYGLMMTFSALRVRKLAARA